MKLSEIFETKTKTKVKTSMNVRELIEELSKLDETLEVKFMSQGVDVYITDVDVGVDRGNSGYEFHEMVVLS